VVKLLPYDHEIMVSSPGKQPVAEIQGKVMYVRAKVVRLYRGPHASRSYVHRAAHVSSRVTRPADA
jgi:hypothetical protein